MKNTMMFGMGVLLLSSCSMMGMQDGAMKKNDSMAMKDTTVAQTLANAPASYVLSPQPNALNGAATTTGANTFNPMGDAVITTSADTVMTTAKLTGLTPDTYYVAHFHMLGNEGTASAPCSTNGQPILASKMVAKSDATGNVTLMGSVAKADIAQARYYNVHTAKDAEGTVADPGVLCSAVTIN